MRFRPTERTALETLNLQQRDRFASTGFERTGVEAHFVVIVLWKLPSELYRFDR